MQEIQFHHHHQVHLIHYYFDQGRMSLSMSMMQNVGQTQILYKVNEAYLTQIKHDLDDPTPNMYVAQYMCGYVVFVHASLYL